VSPVLIATLAGLATAVCWGTSDWLSARGAKKLSPIQVNFAGQIAGIFVAAAILLFSGLQLPTAVQIGRIVVGDSLIITAYIIFVKALAAGAVGIIVPIGNSYPLITVLLSITLLNQHFSRLQFLAMFCVVLGAAVLAYEKNHRNLPLRKLHKDTTLAVIAAIIWGVAFFVLNPLVDKLRWQDLTIISQISATSYGIITLALFNRRKVLAAARRSLTSRASFVAGGIGTLGIAIFYLGSNHVGNVLIPAVLSSISPLVASFLGAVVDQERLGTLKRVGAVIVVAGIVLLNTS
jgi:drug/metabolite transporter (DMT)-like permease